MANKRNAEAPVWASRAEPGAKRSGATGSTLNATNKQNLRGTAVECYSTWTRSLRCASLPVPHTLTHIGAAIKLIHEITRNIPTDHTVGRHAAKSDILTLSLNGIGPLSRMPRTPRSALSPSFCPRKFQCVLSFSFQKPASPCVWSVC